MSDTTQPQEEQVQPQEDKHYTGRFVSLPEALAEAKEVVLGVLLSPGSTDVGAAGQTYCSNARLRVEEVLVGEVKQQELEFAYTLQKLPPAMAEDALQEGKAYILFLKVAKDGSRRAIKIMDGTDANVKLAQDAAKPGKK